MTHSGPVCISVGGGKGGVGKSVVAANLGVAIADLGFRTVIIDADLGAANQHTLFGIDRPGQSLQAFLDKDVRSLEEIASPTGAPRLFLVPGIGAVPGAANLNHAQKLKVMRHIRRLDAEVVVIDVGAGVSFNVLDFFELGDLRLVVSSPQLPAMQNAYCFLKAAVHRGLTQRLENHAQREAFKLVCGHRETDRVSDLRRRARDERAGLDHAFEQVTTGFATRIVGNMLEGPHQRKVLAALSRMASDFLDVAVPVGAHLSMNREVHHSVTRRRPFLLSHPGHEASLALRSLAEALVTEDVQAIREARQAPPAEDPGNVSDEPVRDTDEKILGVTLIDYLRREERVETDHALRVAFGGRTFQARMKDLSPRGTMIEGHLGGEIGDELSLTLVGLPGRPQLRGVVRHVSVAGFHYGVELDARSCDAASDLLEGAPRRSDTSPPQMAATG
ncbi:MAG: hypothetical protein EVA89_19965 [Sandaracinaceae bacterium]|nr:MAG: hypothetical protein EVA89_19965 [Sandaracinaceae bacterium]